MAATIRNEGSVRSGSKDLRRLVSFLGGQGTRLLLGALAIQVATWLQLVFSVAAGGLVDGTLRRPDDAGNVWSHWLRPWFRFDEINHVGFALAVIMTCVVGARFFEYTLFFEAGERAIVRLREALFTRLMHLPMGFFARRRVGDLAGRLLTDLTQVQEHWVNDLRHLLSHGTVVLGSLALMLVTSPRLSLVLALVIPITMVGAVAIGKRIRAEARLTQTRLGESAVILEESLQGIQHVKVNAAETWEVNRFAASLARALAPALRGGRQRALFVALVALVLLGAWVFLMWHGSRMIQGGPGRPAELSPGAFTTFMFCVAFAMSSGGSLAEVVSRVPRAMAAAGRVCEVLDEAAEPAGPAEAPPTGRLRGEVEFSDVWFAYSTRPEEPALRGITLRVRAGEKVALVGASGAGKSTLASLVCRLFDPQQGAIAIDGRRVASYPLPWLRNQLAFVPQEILLFGGTIAENIAYGKPDASPQAIRDAAAQARALDFIEALPQGFDTLVGERGSQLSGGQRQRLAVARAILRDPAILILDEATSALDSQNESQIQEALDGVMATRTCLVIAHRLSTVRRVDRIVVLAGGRIVETGTHAELHALGGVYRELCDHQYFDPGVESPQSCRRS
ncbi:MAG: ABC transporter ATP-binding protein [Verrucomicrobiales bacterium]